MKVLVLSANAFSKTSNNGKTLEAFFSKFGRDELSMLFFRPTSGMSYDYSYASSYFHVSDMDIINSVTHFCRKCGREISEGNDGHQSQAQNAGIYGKVKHPMRSSRVLIRDLLWKLFPRWKRGGLLEWAKRESPDLIFAYLGGGEYMYNVLGYLANELRIPYAIFYGDDYILYTERKSLLDKILLKRQKAYYSEAIKNASARFCVGDLMANDYTSFFGYSFSPIMNSVPQMDYQPKKEGRDGRISIAYLGGLHLNRWKMLAKFAEALPDNADLHIYSGTTITEEMSCALQKERINLHPLIPANQALQVMLASDVLIHVESDEREYRLYTRLSLSTKIPEYLMCGRMIVGYGPVEVGSMRFISDNDLGVVISSDLDVAGIAEQMRMICQNADMRQKYGEKGHNYAIKRFNKDLIAATFKETLTNIVVNYSKK